MRKPLEFCRAAVVAMDFEPGILRILKDARVPLLKRVNKTIGEARRAGATIIHVNVGFRPGYPEISPRNLRFNLIKQTQFLKPGPDCEVDPDLVVEPGDLRMAKRRFGAFAGNDLEVVLRSHEINTLILMGVSTSGAVLSTVRYAADIDYRIVVARDCCADANMVMHELLCDQIFPMQAEVMTSMELTELAERAVDRRPNGRWAL
jgi:nicotinamidase-related amidase